MTDHNVGETVRGALAEIAPEIDMDELDPDAAIRDQVDMDSMDFLNFVIALHEATGVDIPEADYPRLSSLSGAVSYLREKTAGSDGAG
jgi:acyl carrier protein